MVRVSVSYLQKFLVVVVDSFCRRLLNHFVK